MRTPSRWRGWWAAFAVAVAVAPFSAHGACLPAGTSGDDTIVCTGTDVAGVRSDEGDDAIAVRPGASVAVGDRQDPGAAAAEAAVRAIDAGTGADSVVNHGDVAASAAAVSGGNAPFATATALGASAGIPWFVGTGGPWQDALRDAIRSLGSISAAADSTAGGSVAGVLGNITGTSTADAAGIRTGQGGADIVNAGSLDVLGRAQSHVAAEADAPDETVTATSRSAAAATAVGIDAAGGDNRVRNEGPLSVSAVVQDAVARSEARSGSSDATARADVAATATATGISTGAGRDDIRNTGRLTVVADTDAVAEALALTPSAARFETANASGIARATGIDAGAGSNVIRNDGTLNVRAIATARASTFGGIGGFSIAFGATATGIKVGDGGSEVRNTGTIDVLASGRAHGVSNAIAVGILGGNGDDTVVNQGTIFTGVLSDPAVLRALVLADESGTTIASGIRGGVAISGAGGTDSVTLTGTSRTVGNIDLGDGDDRLTIIGPATVIGGIQAGVGTDTLVLDGTGSLASAPLGFEQAVKQGVGIYTLPSLAPVQRLTVREGALRLSSSYQFNPAGTFQATVYADGRHGQLAVAGTAALGGTLQILRGPGTFRNGTRHSVVVANAVTDWFSNIILPPSTPLVSFRVNGLSDQVQVETVVQRVTTVATNPTYQRVAQHLDRIMPDASGDLADVLGEFQTLPAGGFDRAFASLSPAVHDSLTQAALGGTRPYTQSLQRRLDTVRALVRTAGDAAPSGPVLLAAAEGDPSLIPILGTYRLAPVQAKQGLWASGFGQWDDQDTTPGFTGYTARTGGFTVGYDYTFGGNLTAGLSLGYADTDVDWAASQGGGRVQGLFPSVYASYFTTTAYVEGALSYGHNWYKNQRQLVIGGIERTATSEHQGNAFAAYLGAGYAYPLGDWAVGPIGGLQYVYLAENSFQETGAGSLDLSVAGRDTHSLVSELGVRVNGRVKTAVGTLIPDLSLVWRYDFALDDRVVTTTYAGAPGAAFSIAGQPTSQHGVVVRPGLTVVHPAGVSTTLRYVGQLQNDFQSHAIFGEVRVQF